MGGRKSVLIATMSQPYRYRLARFGSRTYRYGGPQVPPLQGPRGVRRFERLGGRLGTSCAREPSAPIPPS
jgi:hypothetical protein